MPNLAPYKKFIVALAMALGVLGTAVADGVISPSEGIEVVLVFLGAIGVYQVENKPTPEVSL